MLQQIKIVLLNLFAILRRALCCRLSRRRQQHSMDADFVVVIDNRPTTSKQRDWNSWGDDRPQTVEEHIEQYRERMARPPTPTQEPEPDFFSDLTPVIQPQPKFYLPANEAPNESVTKFSRLEATTDVPFTSNAHLEDWSEDDAGGWEQLDSKEAKQLIREKRREARTQRKIGKPLEINPYTPSNSDRQQL